MGPAQSHDPSQHEVREALFHGCSPGGLAITNAAGGMEAQRLSLDESKRWLGDVMEADAARGEIGSTMRDALLNWPARVSGLIADGIRAVACSMERRSSASNSPLASGA